MERTQRQRRMDFNPPTPWGVGHAAALADFKKAYISIHPLRGEWDVLSFCGAFTTCISIHPLRGEWDISSSPVNGNFRISIHPLRGEWDRHKNSYLWGESIFQSTHSVGSGTYNSSSGDGRSLFQSTHSVGSGTAHVSVWLCGRAISIHPLRGEWDVEELQ